jgi:hypothetical protein
MPEESGEETQEITEEERKIIVTVRVGKLHPDAEGYNRSINMSKIACYQCLYDCWIANSSVNILAGWEKQGYPKEDILVLCMECALPYLQQDNAQVSNINAEQMQEVRDYTERTMGDDRCT